MDSHATNRRLTMQYSFENRRALAVALACLGLLSSAAANAIDHQVIPMTPSELKQAFVDADANPNDAYFVYLSPRLYDVSAVGSLTLTKGQVYLYGAPDMKRVYFYAVSGGGQVVPFKVAAAAGFHPYLSLSGVHVMNGRSNGDGGGGINVRGGNVALYYTWVHNNVSDWQGSGVFIYRDSTVYMWRSVLDGNSNTNVSSENCGGGVVASGGGLGLFGSSTTQATIIDSTIKNNVSCRGGGISSQGDTNSGPQVYLYNVTLVNNSALYQGGGIYAFNNGRFDVYFTSIMRNTGATVNNVTSLSEERGGGGMSFDGYRGSVYMAANILAENTVNNPSRKSIAGIRYNNSDCQSTGVSRTTKPSDTGVQGNLIGKLDRCTFLGSLNWHGIGSDANPFVPGMQPTMNVSTSWVDGFTVIRPSSSGDAWQSYSPSFSPGNGRLSLGCRSEDELDETTFEDPCTPGSIESPF
jgi:hypothetical protein